MLKTINRILSGLPTFVVAFAALYATAYPEAAKGWFSAASEALKDSFTFGLSAFGLIFYSIAWVWTSLEPTTRRARIQKGVREHIIEMIRLRDLIYNAKNFDELEQTKTQIDRSFADILKWVNTNMGSAAYRQLNSPPPKLIRYSWFGEHTTEEIELRSSWLAYLDARRDVLTAFLASDGWDGPT